MKKLLILLGLMLSASCSSKPSFEVDGCYAALDYPNVYIRLDDMKEDKALITVAEINPDSKETMQIKQGVVTKAQLYKFKVAKVNCQTLQKE